MSISNMLRQIAASFAVCLLVMAGGVRGQCGAIATFADGLTPTNEIHVATNGSNSSGNGSAANPYATIAFAASQAVPGSAIRIHPGTYSGGTFLNNLHGTAQAPI